MYIMLYIYIYIYTGMGKLLRCFAHQCRQSDIWDGYTRDDTASKALVNYKGLRYLCLLRVSEANEVPISSHKYIGEVDDIQAALKPLNSFKLMNRPDSPLARP